MTDPAQIDPEEEAIVPSDLGFPVVGIGASAGGLDAVRRMLSLVAPDCGMAFVVVMHLSPDHESALGAILQRAARIPVSVVTETTPIEPNHAYVIPPAKLLAMNDGNLRVSDMPHPLVRRNAIDHFFRTLAQAHGERAIGVVLSGTGADGAQGLKRVKELGGLALVQSLDDAEFDAMPKAAMQAAAVDFELPAQEMAGKLAALWDTAQRVKLPGLVDEHDADAAAALSGPAAEEALSSILALLRKGTGHDFVAYKRGTILRRLARRMQVKGAPDLPGYRALLDDDPAEIAALLQDLLISVTNFFRDPEAFTALGAALEASIAGRPDGEPMRAWVAGCATGEEAYSVAITLRELSNGAGLDAQLFASDIDERAVAFARAGLYPASIATDLSPDRLLRYFIEQPGGYRIAKPVREGIVFSAHNVLRDPPFTRLDLVCCRNLMIYLDRQAQARLLASFHFALRPGGLLFLGASETADVAGAAFEPVDRARRIYRARPSAAFARMAAATPVLAPPRRSQRSPDGPTTPQKPALQMLHERALRDHAPPTVLVDADDTVLHVSGRAAHLLRLPEGAPTNKLLALTRPELRPELRAALARAAQTGRTVEAPRATIVINGEARSVAITVRPVAGESPPGIMLVMFDEIDESMVAPLGGHPSRDPALATLEAELERAQQRLLSAAGESAASNDDLRASNEELQTINEDLRSMTEELETSREEIQSVNEELSTVNAELTTRMEEAGNANDDLANLMTSAEMGTVLVDAQMRVKRFTPQAATLFNLLPADAGRRLLDISHSLDYPELAADLADALRELRRVEREVRSTDGRWFLARTVPYRTAAGEAEGVVLAFFDVTARKEAEARVGISEQRMMLVAQGLRDYAVMTLDETGAVASWSPGAQSIFGHAADEVIGRSFDFLFTEEDRLAGAPAAELATARERGRSEDDRWLVRKDGERVYCSGVVTTLSAGGTPGFAKIARDLTGAELASERRDAALAGQLVLGAHLREVAAIKDEFLAVVSHELKNPLSMIQMHTQLLSRLPGFGTDARAARSTRAILASVASQAGLIDDLLELSRANLGKVPLALAPFDLAALVRVVVETLTGDAAAKGQTLRADLPAVRIVADASRVEQVVWNLLANAIKFTPAGGHIGVTAAVEGSTARLSVEDDGIGLDARHLESVFEMFQQVETGAGRMKAGLGVGLALVKRLTELHGGRVQAESAGLGRGARFSVWLPLDDAAGTLPGVAEGARPLVGLRLLLVDDEPELLEAFGDLLEADGADVTLAHGAERALELARSRRFDAVLSDIGMPGRDGHWLARHLRAGAETRSLALVAVSGMSRDVDRERALESGFDAFLGKPLDFAGLASTLTKSVEERRARTGPDRETVGRPPA